jgi:hypothetical protein
MWHCRRRLGARDFEDLLLLATFGKDVQQLFVNFRANGGRGGFRQSACARIVSTVTSSGATDTTSCGGHVLWRDIHGRPLRPGWRKSRMRRSSD